MEDTWFSRDLPVLEEIIRGIDGPSGLCEQRSVEANMGMDRQTATAAFMALKTSGLLTHTTGRGPSMVVTGVSGEARERAGQWPSAQVMAERIITELEQQAETEPDPEKKSRIKSFLKGTGQTGRDIAVDIMASVVKQQIGG